MALLMVSPMAILMLLLMWPMFKNKKMNYIILACSFIIFIVSFIFLRKQIFIADKQYMQAMIPHHSSAILTSQQANIQKPEVKELADQIIDTQIREIELMKQYLQK
jgi:integral membrane sensor domain MASE1